MMKNTKLNIGAIISVIVFASAGIYFKYDGESEPKNTSQKTFIKHNNDAYNTSNEYSKNDRTDSSKVTTNTPIHSEQAPERILKPTLLDETSSHQELELTINQLLISLDEQESQLERDGIFDQLVSLGIENEEIANLLSVKLVDAYRAADSEEKRIELVELMLTLPGEASQKFGYELMGSSSDDERLIGLELMRTSDILEQSTNQELMLDAIWSEDNEDISATAIDIIGANPSDPSNRESTLSELNNIASVHSSDTVRASALIKMADIDQSQQTQDRITDALNSNSYTLQIASAIAIKRHGIVSPEIKRQLVTLNESKKTPTRLRYLAGQILYGK